MRPKAFKRARPAGFWAGEYAKLTDAELDPRLAELVVDYRARLWRLSDGPDREEVRESLRRLSMMPKREAAERWRSLDAAVRVEIDRAHWEQFRRQHGPAVAYEKGIAQVLTGPDDLPALARLALETMERQKAGRPRTAQLAIDFAADLARIWVQETGRKPTIQIDAYPPTDFQSWARDLFVQTGFPVGDLYKQLQAGVKAAKTEE